MLSMGSLERGRLFNFTQAILLKGFEFSFFFASHRRNIERHRTIRFPRLIPRLVTEIAFFKFAAKIRNDKSDFFSASFSTNLSINIRCDREWSGQILGQ